MSTLQNAIILQAALLAQHEDQALFFLLKEHAFLDTNLPKNLQWACSNLTEKKLELVIVLLTK
jgi:hypothetical protein